MRLIRLHATDLTQACVTFVATLTNPNTDGRIIIEGCAPDPTRGVPGGLGAAGPHSRQGSCKAGDLEAEPRVRFILLNAAACFSTVLSEARSVVLASGTLSPIQVTLFNTDMPLSVA